MNSIAAISGNMILLACAMASVPSAVAAPAASLSLPSQPLAFEANEGQIDKDIRFVAFTGDYGLYLQPAQAHLVFYGNPESDSDVLKIQFLDANPAAEAHASKQLPSKVNYLIGQKPVNWHSNISTYAKIQFRSVYPGIDVVYYGNGNQLEFDCLVTPSANVKLIRLHFEGAESLSVLTNGDLAIAVRGGQLLHHKPTAYQYIAGRRKLVDATYVTKDRLEVGLKLGTFDCTKPVIIDPTLVYSKYHGGRKLDEAFGNAVDAQGNVYVTGITYSRDFVVPPSRTPLKHAVAFVSKFDSSGRLQFSTYFGGSDDTFANAIAIHESGIYVCGNTDAAAAFPKSPILGDRPFACGKSFVVKLATDGSPIYSSLFGGTSCKEVAHGIAVDTAGLAYVAGQTDSDDFEVVNGFQEHFGKDPGGNGDGYIVKLNGDGTRVLYSTYFGGTSEDICRGIAVDDSGTVYVTGDTASSDFPTLNPIKGFQGMRDAFVAKIDTTKSGPNSLVWSTLLGGSGDDIGVGLVLDRDSNIYVAGETRSMDFPTIPAVFPNVRPDTCAALFVTKLDNAGLSYAYSTYLRAANPNGDCISDVGVEEVAGNPIAIDACKNVFLTGYVEGAGLPAICGFDSSFNGGKSDAFVAKLDPNGTAPIFVTYLGGQNRDVGRGIALDSTGSAYIVGLTESRNFPSATSARGGGDAFLSKVDPMPLCQGDPQPQITCGPDIVAINDGGSCFATVPVVQAVAQTDCSAVNAIGVRDDDPAKPLWAPYPVGTTTITWTSPGALMCSQRVVVQDKEAPRISCPSDHRVLLLAPGQTSASVNVGVPLASDNCGVVAVTGQRSDNPNLPLTAPYPLGRTTIQWTAYDATGLSATCAQQITVLKIPPISTCLETVLTSHDPGNQPGTGSASFILGLGKPLGKLQYDKLVATATAAAKTDAQNRASAAGNLYRCDTNEFSVKTLVVSIGSTTTRSTTFQPSPPIEHKAGIMISATCPWSVTISCCKP